MRLKVMIKAEELDGDNIGYPKFEIVDTKTGESLKWVRKISFDIEPGDIPLLKLEVYDFDMEYEGEGVAEKVKPEQSKSSSLPGLMDVTSLGGGRQQWYSKRPGPPEAGYRDSIIPKAE